MKDARLVSKLTEEHRTVVQAASASVGSRDLLIIAGPCAVESDWQMNLTAEALKSAPIQALRGCIFKPRTSPYSFQGMGADGIAVLRRVKEQHRLPLVTEVMSAEHLNAVQGVCDMLQIGSRNMQNFELLKAAGRQTIPVILKRGLSSTIEEFVLAAEYIASHGNGNIILCERGIRSFDTFTRNVLDLGAVVALKQLTHLPVIVDPSHAAGKSELVADLAKAAIACGADGLIIECHPRPSESVSDARQALSLSQMVDLVQALRPIARAVGRRIPEANDKLGLPVTEATHCPGHIMLSGSDTTQRGHLISMPVDHRTQSCAR